MHLAVRLSADGGEEARVALILVRIGGGVERVCSVAFRVAAQLPAYLCLAGRVGALVVGVRLTEISVVHSPVALHVTCRERVAPLVLRDVAACRETERAERAALQGNVAVHAALLTARGDDVYGTVERRCAVDARCGAFYNFHAHYVVKGNGDVG